MTGAMGSHQSHRALTTTWLTPPHILAALGDFDLDPCAAAGWPTARQHIILPDDGLTEQWSGRVWLNPPYGAEAWLWLARLAEHGSGTALIFARTETAGFVREVWGKASAVLFLHGRLHFHYPDGRRAPANSGPRPSSSPTESRTPNAWPPPNLKAPTFRWRPHDHRQRPHRRRPAGRPLRRQARRRPAPRGPHRAPRPRPVHTARQVLTSATQDPNPRKVT